MYLIPLSNTNATLEPGLASFLGAAIGRFENLKEPRVQSQEAEATPWKKVNISIQIATRMVLASRVEMKTINWAPPSWTLL